MPVKSRHRPHHVGHKKEKRNKRFLKVYAPYIPLLLIIGAGWLLAFNSEFEKPYGQVESYAISISDSGLLKATNEARVSEGLKPLSFNEQLDKAAYAKAADMSQHDYWSHTSPEGKEPWQFVTEAGYDFEKAAENLAYGFETSSSTVSGWMNSTSHRANLMDPELTEVGFGFINDENFQDKGEQTVVVALYGKPSSAAGTPLSTSSEIGFAKASPADISFVQTLTNGQAPWSGFAVGLLVGGLIMYLMVKHSRRLRRTLKHGERFIIKHPVLDMTLVALIALAAVASQTVGSIH